MSERRASGKRKREDGPEETEAPPRREGDPSAEGPVDPSRSRTEEGEDVSAALEEGGPHGEAGGRDGVEGEPSEVERLRAELGRLNDRHLRLAAEFENFRKRSHDQLGQSGIRAQASLVEKLLEVLDDFERVASVDPEQATADSLFEGVSLVERKLRGVLEEAGLEPIDPQGERFDPNSMEALMREPAASEQEDDTVSRVLQRGFRFRGQLVRPARVGVLKYDG